MSAVNLRRIWIIEYDTKFEFQLNNQQVWWKSREEDDPENIFIHIEAKEDSIDEILNKENGVELDVKITDGIESFRATLNKKKINEGNGDGKNQNDSEWYNLFLQALFESIPIKLNDSIEFIGKKIQNDDGNSAIELELKTKISGSINKTLGTVKIDHFNPGDDFSYADCLFQWCKIMSDTSKSRQQARLKEQEKNQDLIKQNEQIIKFKKQLVDDSKRKDTYTLKVMTRLLNEKKDHYQKLLEGKIQDEADDFNVIAIKTIKDDLAKEEEIINKPKTKRYKKNPQTSKPVKKLNLRNRNTKKEEEKDEDGDEFIPDSNDEDQKEEHQVKEENNIKGSGPDVKAEDQSDDYTKIKKEESSEVAEIPKASKAKSEKSIHFKFKNDKEEDDNKDDDDDDDDQDNEKPKEDNDDTETEEDATEDDEVNDDDKDVEMNNDTEEDNGTVTDTESDDDE
ncbi:Halomucin [Wickerhamomyces ciferrii]|uniref:Halomucin n=1 Tax=Wickerhamomyces ciferrii (strain ATCC 14091 / BCRC 22168 / CBS 111 / JCM 3599 / NBRC 0793 / NRRL Y-1031 F-60-10) TaxID=1206466 RepID=K0KMK5_WICCF|nr:Halomucin [Wickerhamomyces ciferrii]CCH42604.1 Halomucin [Wickerhamomyces ciferrii]